MRFLKLPSVFIYAILLLWGPRASFAQCGQGADPPSMAVPAGGGTFTFRVTGATTCTWAAFESDDFVEITSTNQSTDIVAYRVDANPLASERSGLIRVGKASHRIVQAPLSCSFALSDTAQEFAPAGGDHTFQVVTGSGCSSTASVNRSWVRITSAPQGSGPRQVTYHVEENRGTSDRTADITVGGRTHRITQRGLACQYALTPSSRNYPATLGSGSFSVATAAGCSWSATEDQSWLRITGGNGPGPGTVSYTLDQNPLFSSRSGTIRVGGRDHVVSQEGMSCSYTLAPPALAFDRAGGSQPVTLTTNPQTCTWTLSSSQEWIVPSAPATGTGSTPFSVQAGPFTGFGSRSGTINMAGRVVQVTQTGCPLPALVPDQAQPATLELADCPSSFRGDGFTSDRFTFSVAPGQAFAVQIDAAFDSYLHLLDPAGTLIAINDDSGGTLNSRIPPIPFLGSLESFLPLPSGTYTVEVSSFNAGATGAYTVTLVSGTSQDGDGDGMPDGVELVEGYDPFAKDNDVVDNFRLFVMQVYRDFLTREGDAAGIAFWTDRLETGAVARSQVIEAFFYTPEFQDVTAAVVRLYRAVFLRIPDTDGLLFWIRQRRLGVPIDNIANFFTTSPEFIARYGSLGDGGFVDLVYLNVFQRPSDPAGRAFWVGELASNRRTRGQVMLAFSESEEYRTGSAREVFIIQTYVGLLGRAPDPDGFGFWLGFLGQGQPVTAMIDGFLGAPEYRFRFLPDLCDLDSDGDRLPDCVETGTGTFVGPADTGTDPFSTDTDLDAIPDGDEVLGTVSGLDLPALGANPLRRDIFIEYDWFDDSLECGAHSHRPAAAALAAVTAAFAAAPTTNPDGTSGIALHHDFGQGGPFTGGNRITDADGVLGEGIRVDSGEFRAYKDAHLAPRRQPFFHYAILPHRYDTASANSGQAEFFENDFIVSLACRNTVANLSAAVMHGLGHNLGLLHGGISDCNWKPNYNSVMNFRYEFAGVDTTCTATGSSVLDFSHGNRGPLVEGNLDERQGVCNSVAIDWNGNAQIEAAVAYELNRAGVSPFAAIDNRGCSCAPETLGDYNDWGSLFLNSIDYENSFYVVDCNPNVPN